MKVQQTKDELKSHALKTTTQCNTINPKDCNIFVQAETRYDNELLNHPDLFNHCTKILGIKSVMELSPNLSNELIHESLESHDYDVAVGGLMSLQTE